MSAHHAMTEGLLYGYKLVGAGVSGLRIGEKDHNDIVASSIARSARKALLPAAATAAVAMLAFRSVQGRRDRWLRIFGCSALAFSTAFGWTSRVITSDLLSSAAREVNKVRDQHWLELNPIDYA
ncbi:MAG: hypothetical protein ACXVZV_06675 [Terriglobales bacterium]